jgi:hypothetical protein
VTHDLRENVLAGVHRSLRDRNRSRRSEQVGKIQVDNAKKGPLHLTISISYAAFAQ